MSRETGKNDYKKLTIPIFLIKKMSRNIVRSYNLQDIKYQVSKSNLRTDEFKNVIFVRYFPNDFRFSLTNI